jgi:hypothetical protein
VVSASRNGKVATRAKCVNNATGFGGVIVAELLHHRNGERHQRMSLLPAIEPTHEALNVIHRSAGNA